MKKPNELNGRARSTCEILVDAEAPPDSDGAWTLDRGQKARPEQQRTTIPGSQLETLAVVNGLSDGRRLAEDELNPLAFLVDRIVRPSPLPNPPLAR